MMIVTLSRYLFLSVVAAAGVVYHALSTRQQFYRAAMFLSSSKISVALLGNLVFALALFIHQVVIKLFLGSLRDIEQEMIRERLSSAVMETLLALTIFREEFSAYFVALFASLVFIKVLHWLIQDRVDYVEVTPNITILGHLRIVSFMVVLLALDAVFLQYTISGTIQASGQSVLLLFAFEYVILASTVVRYALKYGMSMVDLAMDGNWTGKGTAVFYLELLADFVHLFVYGTFFVLVLMHYGMPLHLIRDLYSTFRNFRIRIADFLRFRQVTARLDRFPNATADDLRRSDGVCIICREEMTEVGANKRLFCGHVFHVHCLRSWLERQQNCPTCRASVFRRQTAGQHQGQPAAVMAAAPGADLPAGGADGGDAAHRHPAHAAAGGAEGAVVRLPAEPHPGAAAAAAFLRHRRVGNAIAAGTSTGPAAPPAAGTEVAASAGPSRTSSQPAPGAEAGAAGAAGQPAPAPYITPLNTSTLPATASPAGSGHGPSAPTAAGTAGTTSGVQSIRAAMGSSSFSGDTAAASVQGMIDSMLMTLRAEELRMLQNLRLALQQRGGGPLRQLTSQQVTAAMAELAQSRVRNQQVEAALAGILRTQECEGASGSVAGPLPTHPPFMLPVNGPSPGNGTSTVTSIPFVQPFASFTYAPGAHVLGISSPAMMPVVPFALPTAAFTVAATSSSAMAGPPSVAAVQVPLHHHQVAAAAAAAAASAAAAMFGAGVIPTGGGMFYVPQPLGSQPPQSQTAAAAAVESGQVFAVPTNVADAGPSGEGPAAKTEPEKVEEPIQQQELGSGAGDGSSSSSDGAAVAPAPADGETGAGADEDPQEVVRRIRLQRFCQ